MLIENYIPYVKYNAGIETNLPVTINGNLTVTGTTTIAGISLTDLTVTGNTTIGNAGSDTLAITGVTTITGNVTLVGALIGTPQALTGSGAINVTSLVTVLNTTGGGTYTLANGTAGQVKHIVLGVDSGTDAVVTPATATGFTTITLADAGDGVTLVYTTTTGWICVGNNGAALA